MQSTTHEAIKKLHLKQNHSSNTLWKIQACKVTVWQNFQVLEKNKGGIKCACKFQLFKCLNHPLGFNIQPDATDKASPNSPPLKCVWVKSNQSVLWYYMQITAAKDLLRDWANLTWQVLALSLVHVSTSSWQWLLPSNPTHVVQLVTDAIRQFYTTGCSRGKKNSSNTWVLGTTSVHLKWSTTCYYTLFEGHRGDNNLLQFQCYMETCLNIASKVHTALSLLLCYSPSPFFFFLNLRN